MIVGLLLLGITVFSASTFGSFKSFLIWAVPLGITGSLMETFSTIMLCRLGGPGSSKMLNFAHVFYCLGAIIAPLLIATVLNYGLSWRIAFLCLGSMILVIALWFTWQTRNFIEPQWQPSEISKVIYR